VRAFYDGTIILSEALPARSILAAQAIGADLAYIGTRFIAKRRGQRRRGLQADDRRLAREDIVYSNLFTGVHGNYLRGSIVNAASTPTRCPSRTRRDELRSGAARPGGTSGAPARASARSTSAAGGRDRRAAAARVPGARSRLGLAAARN